MTAIGQLYSRMGDFTGIVGVDYYLSGIESFREQPYLPPSDVP